MKQQKIKEAYGEYYEKCNPDKNGWSVKRKGIGFEQLKKQIPLEYDKPHNAYAFRPLFLKGIENNNGWIKIEIEDDLPKKRMYCWFLDKYTGVVFGEFLNKGKDEINFILANATYYKVIDKPEPPIY